MLGILQVGWQNFKDNITFLQICQLTAMYMPEQLALLDWTLGGLQALGVFLFVSRAWQHGQALQAIVHEPVHVMPLNSGMGVCKFATLSLALRQLQYYCSASHSQALKPADDCSPTS